MKKNAPKVEKIIHHSEVIALIIRKGFKPEGIHFFSPDNYSLQLGAMTRPKGYQVVPHIHNLVKRISFCTQEVLFIQSGQVRVDFYSFKQFFLKSRILNAGDLILFVKAGHGIEFIKKSVIFEVKNGPYVKGADKGRFTANKETEK